MPLELRRVRDGETGVLRPLGEVCGRIRGVRGKGVEARVRSLWIAIESECECECECERIFESLHGEDGEVVV